MVSKDIFVAKHTAAVHIDNKLTLLERKVFNILLKNSRSRSIGDMHTIHLKDLAELLDAKSTTNYEYLKEVLHSLVRKSLRFNILNKDRKKKWESSISILAEIHCDGGMVYYRPSTPFMELLRPSSYAYLNIRHQTSLSSKHSLALWEYCCEQLDSVKSTQLITQHIVLGQLKELLGVEGAGYEEYKVFNSKILKKAVAEINKKTDINISSVIVRKNGAKVDSIAFNVSRVVSTLVLEDHIVDDAQLQLLDTDIIATINNSLERQDLDIEAKDIGLSGEGVERLLKKYTPSELLQGVRMVQKTMDRGVQIKNIPGYLCKILEQGIVEIVDIDNEIEKKQKARLYESMMKFKGLPAPVDKFFQHFADRYENDFVNWISQLEFISYQDGVLTLYTKSDFYMDWINSNLNPQVRKCGTLMDENFVGFEIVNTKHDPHIRIAN